MNIKRLKAALAGLVLSVSGFADAGIIIFDIDASPNAWLTAVTGFSSSTAYDFSLDSDYGITGFDGPLTSAGSSLVSAGILGDNITMSVTNNGVSTLSLVGVGASAGFGNTANSVLANLFVDSFNILFGNATEAFEFNTLTLQGSGLVDINVTDNGGGSTLFSNLNVGTGHNFGILATGGSLISSINIYDVSGGAEGLQGVGTTYTVNVPEPSTFAIFVFGIMGLASRRFKKE
jgi:hypothetical protein